MWRWTDSINVSLWPLDVAQLIACMEGEPGEVHFQKNVNTRYHLGHTNTSFKMNEASKTLTIRMGMRATSTETSEKVERHEEIVLKPAEVILLRTVFSQSLQYLVGVPQAMSHAAPSATLPMAGGMSHGHVPAGNFQDDIEVDENGYPRPRRLPDWSS